MRHQIDKGWPQKKWRRRDGKQYDVVAAVVRGDTYRRLIAMNVPHFNARLDKWQDVNVALQDVSLERQFAKRLRRELGGERPLSGRQWRRTRKTIARTMRKERAA